MAVCTAGRCLNLPRCTNKCVLTHLLSPIQRWLHTSGRCIFDSWTPACLLAVALVYTQLGVFFFPAFCWGIATFIGTLPLTVDQQNCQQECAAPVHICMHMLVGHKKQTHSSKQRRVVTQCSSIKKLHMLPTSQTELL